MAYHIHTVQFTLRTLIYSACVRACVRACAGVCVRTCTYVCRYVCVGVSGLLTNANAFEC